MRMRTRLIVLFVPGLIVPAGPSFATAVHRPAAVHQVSVAPVRAPSRAVRPVVVRAPAMVMATGANRTSAPVRTTGANGIAGVDMVRPVVRSAAGGASTRSGGIDGGTVHRRP